MRDFDYSRLEKQTWDSEILELVAKTHEFKGRQELIVRQNSDKLEWLVDIAKIQSTEYSNKIEGIVTTNMRIKQLISDKTTPRNRDEKEIMGYRDVLNVIHESFEYIPISTSYILQLHKMLMKYSETSFGGNLKNVQNHISATYPDGMSKILFTPLSPAETPIALERLCTTFNFAIGRGKADSLLLIINFIKDFLCIHPFNDGNGRMSRVLTTLLLYRSGYFIGKYISLEKKIENTKDIYYQVLQESSEDWHEGSNDNTPFVKYMLRIILSAYRDFEERLEIIGSNNSSYNKVKQFVDSSIGRFTKSDVMSGIPTISKASVENALKSMVENGSIERHGSGKATYYLKINGI